MPLRLSIEAKPGKKIPTLTIRDGKIIVAVQERAVDGRANAAIVRALADWLGIPVGRVSIVAGLSARRKIVEVAGVDAATLGRRIAALAAA